MTPIKRLQERIDFFRQQVKTPKPWRKSFQARSATRPQNNVEKSAHETGEFYTRTYAYTGWAVIVFFLFGGLTWAATSKLDGAAIAHGTVGVESNRKSVAHLEGGIIQAIHVKEGDRVVKGQPILDMDPTRAHATLDLLQARWDAFVAKKARLDAETRGRDAITFPDQLLDRAVEPGVLDLMESEMELFATRASDRAEEDAVLVERIAKSRSDIRALKARQSSTEQRSLLLQEERDMMAGLVKDGLIARNRLLSIARQVVEADGERQETAAQITRASDQIAEYEIERRLIQQRHRTEVANERVDVLEALAETKERIRAARDILERATVVAPTDGRVVALRQHTIGGVVQAGDPIVDIVPDHDRIVLDLRIHPDDIDVVYPGQTARVRLTAFNSRTTPMIVGDVVHISADQIIDPASGIGYFHGRVIPRSGHSGGMPSLQSGMQAEVYLLTAERTVLDYLIDPFIRATHRAGREL